MREKMLKKLKNLNSINQKVLASALAVLVAISLTVGMIYNTHVQNVNAENKKQKDLKTAVETAAGIKDSKDSEDKTETVYVITDPDGTPNDVIVSDHLKNTDEDVVIEDKTDLTDIKNTNGDETYTKGSDDAITWAANGNDIYYQGSTDKDLPVDMTISYELDGEEVSVDDLAGATGHLKIRFDYTNNEKVTVKVNGKNQSVYVPFTMISGMLFDSEKVSGVEVTNGTVMNEGDNSIVVGYAFPGLASSLGIGQDVLEDYADDLDIPEYFEIEADVKDFESGMTMTVATNDILNKLDLDDLDTDSLDDSMDKLNDASKQLLDGTAKLADGSETLADAMGTASTGSVTLAKGVTALVNGIGTTLPNTLQKNIDQYTPAANQLDTASTNLSNKVSGLVFDAATASATAAATPVAQTAASVAAKAAANAAATAATKVAGPKAGAAAASATSKVFMSISSDTTSKITQAVQSASAAMKNKVQKVKVVKDDGSTEDMYVVSASDATAVMQGLASALSSGSTDTDAITKEVNSAVTSAVTDTLSSEDTQNAISSAVSDAVTSSLKSDEVSSQVAAAVTSTLKSESVQNSITSAVSKATASDQEEVQNAATAVGSAAGAQGAVTALSAVKDSVEKNFDTASLNKLKAGASQLSGGLTKLDSGSEQIADGAKQLNEGMGQFSDEGISKLVDIYDGDVKTLSNRIEAIQKAGKNYNTFTELSKGQSGSVRFIYKTDEIKK